MDNALTRSAAARSPQREPLHAGQRSTGSSPSSPDRPTPSRSRLREGVAPDHLDLQGGSSAQRFSKPLPDGAMRASQRDGHGGSDSVRNLLREALRAGQMDARSPANSPDSPSELDPGRAKALFGPQTSSRPMPSAAETPAADSMGGPNASAGPRLEGPTSRNSDAAPSGQATAGPDASAGGNKGVAAALRARLLVRPDPLVRVFNPLLAFRFDFLRWCGFHCSCNPMNVHMHVWFDARVLVQCLSLNQRHCAAASSCCCPQSLLACTAGAIWRLLLASLCHHMHLSPYLRPQWSFAEPRSLLYGCIFRVQAVWHSLSVSLLSSKADASQHRGISHCAHEVCHVDVRGAVLGAVSGKSRQVIFSCQVQLPCIFQAAYIFTDFVFSSGVQGKAASASSSPSQQPSQRPAMKNTIVLPQVRSSICMSLMVGTAVPNLRAAAAVP